MTQNLSTTAYGSCLHKMAATPDLSEEDVILKTQEAIHNDPFAMELAFRLAIADLSHLLGESFRATYRSYGTDRNTAGQAWIDLTTICMGDKILGRGRPDSIVSHPVLDEFPALRDIRSARKDHDIVQVARRFQAAYETMNTFDPHKPHKQGISTFDRKLERISEPEPLWVVLAGLKRLLVKSPIEPIPQ